MTKEEKLAFMREMRTIVNGDLVMEKHVENEYVGTAKESIVIHQYGFGADSDVMSSVAEAEVRFGRKAEKRTLEERTPEERSGKRSGKREAERTSKERTVVSGMREAEKLAEEKRTLEERTVVSGMREAEKLAERTGVNAGRKSALPELRTGREKKRKLELMTFFKKGILNAHLSLLYSMMIKEKWIGRETREEDFLALFCGERSDCRIVWAGKYGKGTLVHLFRYMEQQEVISVPKNFSIPNILMGHFVDTKGVYLTNLDNGHAAAHKAGGEIVEFVRLLKVCPGDGLPGGSGDDDYAGLPRDDEFSGEYDDALSAYDMKGLGMRVRK